jgi:hypothetical protein
MADDLSIVCSDRAGWTRAEGATSWTYGGRGEVVISADPDAIGDRRVVAWYFASVPAASPTEDDRRARFPRSDDAIAFVERYAG